MSANFPLNLVSIGCALKASLEAASRPPLVGTPGVPAYENDLRRGIISTKRGVHPTAVE